MKFVFQISIFIVLAFFLFHPSFAQNSPILSLKEVNTVEIEGQKLVLKVNPEIHVEVSIYSPSIVRVRMDRQPLADDFSYAVVSEPIPTQVKIDQNDNEISLVTDSLRVRISKNPYSIAFLTPEGRIINEDETGLTTSWIGEEVTTYKKMQKGERFIGLGEKTGGLDRKGSGYTNWNTDAYGYTTGQDPIYATIPFYVGIHNGMNYGLFFDNTYQSDFNFGASNNRFSSFGAQGGEMNYYFIYHKKLDDIITSYTDLTGRMNLPPIWSLGYQQNRYSYYPETEVYRIAQTLREKKIPADGITLDIHYMDSYKLFTWNKDRFPEPRKMTDKLREMGFKTTLIVDPGIKVENGYGAYERGLADDIFLKYNDGNPYTGQVWPGWCHFPDFTSEKGRAWWQNEVKQFADDGIDGIWNDMNEIATWGQKMPNNVLFDFDGNVTTHKKGRNVYGLEMTRASYEGARKTFNKRPFLLTRAGYSGSQRYTAMWTGDNRSEDDHMLLGIRLLNSLGVSGIAFAGMDIGGFTGNPTTELYARWIQIGAFTPYFRNHTGVNTKSSEPWAHGEEVLEISRNYINLRYRLLPYLYSGFYEATQNGKPLMRTLAIDYTHDDKVYDGQFENQYLFGEAFMIAPFISKVQFGKVYFPEGNWYDLYDGSIEKGNQEKVIPLAFHKLPIYVKESSIIPMQSLVQSTSERPTDTLTIHIYKGDANNSFTYYEDDGESYDYEKGIYHKRVISYSPKSKLLTFAEAEGTLDSKFKNLKVVFHGFTDVKGFKVNGKNMALQDGFVSMINPISTFDPTGVANPVEGYKVKNIFLKNDKGKMTINL